MRRIFALAALVAVVGIVCASSAQARGLYKGHGRIVPHSLYNPWSVRVNGVFGIQGAYQATAVSYDPAYLVPLYRWSDWKFGYYGQGGIEFNLGKGWSIEPYGLYRRIDDVDNYRIFYSPPLGTNESFRSVDSRVYAAGVNFRIYKNWKGGAAYLGIGGGYAHGEAEWTPLLGAEVTATANGGSLLTQQDSGDFQLLTGLDFHPAAVLSLGFELGWRWSGLSDFNEFEGAFGGVRVGFMFGDGD